MKTYLLLSIISFCFSIHAEDRVYFGETGNPYLGYFDGKTFVKSSDFSTIANDYLKAAKKKVWIMDDQGKKSSGHLKTFVADEGEHEPSLKIAFPKSQKPTSLYLLSTKDIVNHSTPVRIQIEPELSKEILKILKESAPPASCTYFENKSVHFNVKSGTYYSFPKVQRVIGFLKLVMNPSSDNDERASFFVLIDSEKKKIIKTSFSHPEWNPEGCLRGIVPQMFFQLKNSEKVYFVGDTESGWESNSTAIYDVETAEPLILKR